MDEDKPITDEDKPITDKENFPVVNLVFSRADVAYEQGYSDGYRSCVVLVCSALIGFFLVERLTR